MYLGETSISRVFCYILGYNTACAETIGDYTLFSKSGRFTDWVREKYEMPEWRALAWSQLLLKICENDEEKAFELLVQESVNVESHPTFLRNMC